MDKGVIIYASTHHGSTKKLVDSIAEKYDIDQIDATKQHYADLSEYDLIGFASGIDFGKFYDSVEQFLENNLPTGKRVFFLYTCAKVSNRFTETIKERAQKRDAIIVGEYGCKGYNTYGPWRLIGGMNKNQPTEKECDEAVRFVKMICENESVTLYQNS